MEKTHLFNKRTIQNNSTRRALLQYRRACIPTLTILLLQNCGEPDPALHPVQEILSLPFIQEVLEFVSFENILIIHILPSFRKVSLWGEP